MTAVPSSLQGFFDTQYVRPADPRTRLTLGEREAARVTAMRRRERPRSAREQKKRFLDRSENERLMEGTGAESCLYDIDLSTVKLTRRQQSMLDEKRRLYGGRPRD